MTSSPWEPHTNLPQADAVFRHLRAVGFETVLTFYPQMRPPMGTIQVAGYPEGLLSTMQWEENLETSGEAHALLLASVLAVARRRGTAPSAQEALP